MKLENLRIGDAFVSTYPGGAQRHGKLLYLSPGSALVEWQREDGRTRTIRTQDKAGKWIEKSFTAGAVRENISPFAEVEKEVPR